MPVTRATRRRAVFPPSLRSWGSAVSEGAGSETDAGPLLMAVNMVMRSGGDESAKRHLAGREAKLGHRRTLERSHPDQRQLDTQGRAMPRRWQTVDVGGGARVDTQ